MRVLRPWQKEALEAWRGNGGRGIIAAATGTGKTQLAVEVLRQRLDEGAHAIVVVPTRVLQTQWLRELRQARVGGRRVGTIGGAEPNPSPDHLVTVAVMDSARSGAPTLMRHWARTGASTLLVVDECHWAGSEYNRGVFAGGATWTMGLSATPERGDDGFDDVLVPSLGPVVYRYSLRNAMDDGVLGDLRLVDLIVDLSRQEQHEYKDLEQRIERVQLELMAQHPELFQHSDWTLAVALGAKRLPLAKRLHALVTERRRMLARSSARLSALKTLLESGLLDGRRSIIFNETIDQAEQAADMASRAGAKISVDHSRLATVERETAHRRFRGRSTNALVVVRTADEGVDVPDADQAILVSGTMNPRQRIQRLGRVVRLSDVSPRAISLLARGTAEESVVAGHDRELLGWSRVGVVTANTGQLADWRRFFEAS